MFRLTRPTDASIAAFRSSQSGLDFAYAPVGCTRGAAPAVGYVLDDHSIELGRGDACWRRARAAIRGWRMFELGWVEVHDPRATIATGTTVAVLVRAFGLYSLNAARIAYVIDESGAFGFAYGTLPDHVESGEERFLVTRDATGLVRYEVSAHSRPRHWLAAVGRPWTRRLQKRFALDSMEAMRRATASESGNTT